MGVHHFGTVTIISSVCPIENGKEQGHHRYGSGGTLCFPELAWVKAYIGFRAVMMWLLFCLLWRQDLKI